MKGHGFYGELAKCPLSIENESTLLVFLLDNSIFSRSIGIATEQLLLLIMQCCSNFQDTVWDLKAFLILAIAQQNYFIVFSDLRSIAEGIARYFLLVKDKKINSVCEVLLLSQNLEFH